MDRVSRELDSAFSTVGFVYLKNHGVNQQLVSCQEPVDVKT
jgi:isopenicillin N synthase-like dioxygenase